MKGFAKTGAGKIGRHSARRGHGRKARPRGCVEKAAGRGRYRITGVGAVHKRAAGGCHMRQGQVRWRGRYGRPEAEGHHHRKGWGTGGQKLRGMGAWQRDCRGEGRLGQEAEQG